MGAKAIARDEFVSNTDPIVKYFSEMGAIPMFTLEEELEAFKEVEDREADVLRQLLVHKNFAKKAIQDLSEAVQANGSRIQELELALRDPVKSGFVPLTRIARFTDVGRDWFEHTFSLAFNADHMRACGVGMGDQYRAWTKKLRALDGKVKQIKSKCIAANLRLVVHVARKYMRSMQNLSLGDLIQEGNFGLIKAVDRFDISRGFRFITYATWWIRANVRRGIQDKEHLVRTPVHLADQVSVVNRAEGQFSAKNGRLPSLAELVKESGLLEKKVHRALEHRTRGGVVSLDAPISDNPDHDGTLMDVMEDTESVAPDERMYRARRDKAVLFLFTTLTPKESMILRWRFGFDDKEPMTLREIGDILEVSRERVRQLEEIAIKKLKARGGMQDFR